MTSKLQYVTALVLALIVAPTFGATRTLMLNGEYRYAYINESVIHIEPETCIKFGRHVNKNIRYRENGQAVTYLADSPNVGNTKGITVCHDALRQGVKVWEKVPPANMKILRAEISDNTELYGAMTLDPLDQNRFVTQLRIRTSPSVKPKDYSISIPIKVCSDPTFTGHVRLTALDDNALQEIPIQQFEKKTTNQKIIYAACDMAVSPLVVKSKYIVQGEVMIDMTNLLLDQN